MIRCMTNTTRHSITIRLQQYLKLIDSGLGRETSNTISCLILTLFTKKNRILAKPTGMTITQMLMTLTTFQVTEYLITILMMMRTSILTCITLSLQEHTCQKSWSMTVPNFKLLMNTDQMMMTSQNLTGKNISMMKKSSKGEGDNSSNWWKSRNELKRRKRTRFKLRKSDKRRLKRRMKGKER